MTETATEYQSNPSLSELRAFVAAAQAALAAVEGTDWPELQARIWDIADKAAAVKAATEQVAALRDRQLQARRTVLAEYDIASLGDAMDQAQEQVYGVAVHKNELLSRYRSVQEEMEVIKAEVQLNGPIDGKNAEIRSAQLTVALNHHPAYIDLSQRSAQLKADMDNADASAEYHRMAYSTVKARLASITAALQLLGS